MVAYIYISRKLKKEEPALGYRVRPCWKKGKREQSTDEHTYTRVGGGATEIHTERREREREREIPPHSNKYLFPVASLQQFYTKGMKAIYTQSKYLK